MMRELFGGSGGVWDVCWTIAWSCACFVLVLALWGASDSDQGGEY